MKFEITLVRRDRNILEIEKVESDDMVQLLSQFIVMLAIMQRRIDEEALQEYRKMVNALHSKEEVDDDIPF